MAITAKSILAQVARDLNDETSIRWTVADLCNYYNDGQRDALVHRPDARNVTASIPLVPGAKQALPIGGEKLIRVTHNTSGTKRAITRTTYSLLDSQSSGWRGYPGSTTIYHFMYDEVEPKAFDVFPPAAIGASVEAEYAAITVDITTPAPGSTTADITGNLSLSDLFANAIRNYVMFRCYSKNTEFTANPQMAAAFYGAYANDLGIEAKGTAAVSPSNAT